MNRKNKHASVSLKWKFANKQSRANQFVHNATNADSFKLLESEIKATQELLQENLKTIKDINRSVYKKRFYNSDYERSVIKSFHEYYKKDDYKEIFLRLIDGLEPKDIATVVRILKRQQDLYESNSRSMDFYNLEDQQQIEHLITDFKKEIYKISEDLYCYHQYLLPVNHFESSVLYYKHGIENIKNIKYTENKDIVDVGGFIGDSVLIFSSLTKKKVYSFEAVSKNYEIMKETIELNKITNAIPEHLALGAEKKDVLINVSGSCSSISDLGAHKLEYTEMVNMTTLDSYVKRHNLNIGLIKVDIEGAEQDFLLGARKTIERDKPILMISIYHNADDFFNIKPMVDSWGLGYKFQIYKPVDFTISREVLLICEIEEIENERDAI